jgi:hypothetical protein
MRASSSSLEMPTSWLWPSNTTALLGQGPEEIAVVDVSREAIGRAALDVGAVIVDTRAEDSRFQILIHPPQTAS